MASSDRSQAPDPERAPAPGSGGTLPGTRSALEDGVSRAIASAEGLGSLIDESLGALLRAHGPSVYSELLFQFAHLRFDPEEAKEHWERIVHQQRFLQEQLTSMVDIRVPLINYFTGISRQLRNPKIIECDQFETSLGETHVDRVTGLRNAKFLAGFLEDEIARARQFNTPVSLLMAGIDDFDAFCGPHGHDETENAMRAVGTRLRRCVRTVDLASSFGDGRFALALPYTPKSAAVLAGERAAHHAGSEGSAKSGGGPARKIALSVGVATCPADGNDPGELIRKAGAALDEARSSNGTRVVPFGKSLRSYRRIRVVLAGRYRLESSRIRQMTTVNVSTGGLLFRADERPSQGALVHCGLHVPGTEQEIEFLGHVVYSGNTPQGYIEVGCRVLEMSAPDRWLLSQFLEELELRGDLGPYQEQGPDDGD